jgi:hypothetical protein
MMLIPENVHPKQTIYYNGAFVLKALQVNGSMDIVDLYIQTKNYQEMSISVFTLCLDWLFLINLIQLDDQKRVELCT